MGYTVEPDQAAYQTMLSEGAAPYETRVNEAESGAYQAFLKEAEEAFKGSDAEKAFGEIKVFESEAYAALEEEFKQAVFAHVNANQPIVDEFKSSLSISTILFWAMACLVGTVQGGIQAVSRSYFGKLVPKERSNEFFGFFDIFGKFSCVIGPALYSVIAAATGFSCYGVLVLIVLFALGLITLIAARKHLDSAVQVN
ncbi:MAG: MFS transporter [Clostridia bacterium]|nr:MFS transporter [Clostridia bacterium]